MFRRVQSVAHNVSIYVRGRTVNEIIFLLIVTATLSIWTLLVTVTLTIADLQTIALEKSLRRHPHSRKWRGTTKLRAQLHLYGDEKMLSRSTMRFALARFQAKPSLQFVEILPPINTPQTVRQLFGMYHMIARAPFVKLRAVLHIEPTNKRWPILSTENSVKMARWWYSAILCVLSIMNLSVLLYVGFVTTLGEPTYLLAYLAIFALWLGWSIYSYPSITVQQKLVLISLLPVSFGYFFWLAVTAPFRPIVLTFQPLIRAWNKSTKSA